ncbi:MAG: hypothetical protein ACXVBW_12125 [Bdellovibrionota bacterium]
MLRITPPRIRHSEWTLIVLFVLLALAASARAGVSVIPAPQSPQAHQKGARADGGAEQDVSELVKKQAEDQKAYGSLNNLNPMSADYGKMAALPGNPAVAPTGPIGQLYKLLSNPAVQGYLKFFNNPVFSAGAEQIMKHPNRMVLLYVEAGWMLFMFIFRTWRLSKLSVSRWGAILWVNFWTFCLFVGAGIVAIPYAVLGEAYMNLMTGALSTWMH